MFINGRELHPLDVAGLRRLGPVFHGRYWVDAQDTFGVEQPLRGRWRRRSGFLFLNDGKTFWST